MSIISKTGIEGFDYTWSGGVFGCLTGCSYCWARQCVRRFAKNTVKAELNFNRDIACPTVAAEMTQRLKDFQPTWLEYQFAKAFPKKPARIVVGWQSDIAYWQPEWMERVLGKIREYPQHTFFFLTKGAGRRWYSDTEFPKNCWLGITSTGEAFAYAPHPRNVASRWFLSLEPLLTNPNRILPSCLSWLIIGAQTGRGDKVIPKREWVEAVISQAKELSIPVYLKDNLLKAVPGLPNLKEIPNGR